MAVDANAIEVEASESCRELLDRRYMVGDLRIRPVAVADIGEGLGAPRRPEAFVAFAASVRSMPNRIRK
jgi:hypothetical protein